MTGSGLTPICICTFALSYPIFKHRKEFCIVFDSTLSYYIIYDSIVNRYALWPTTRTWDMLSKPIRFAIRSFIPAVHPPLSSYFAFISIVLFISIAKSISTVLLSRLFLFLLTKLDKFENWCVATKFKYTWQIFKFDFLENETLYGKMLLHTFLLFVHKRSPHTRLYNIHTYIYT